MRRLARLVFVATIAGGTVLASAPAAMAGGPTSVLLVSPSSGSIAALYVTDDRYYQLQRALGEQPAADGGAPDLHGGAGTTAINVTWLIHDVMVWRVDRVFVNVDGGPWVETRTSFDGPVHAQPATVHRSSDPALLLALLDRLGLPGDGVAANGHAPDGAGSDGIGSGGAASGGAASDGRGAEPTASGRPASTAVQEPAGGAPFGWWWVVAGLVVGAALGAGARPVITLLARTRIAGRA
ncbi:MAG: hypothetical protein ACRDSN_03940 [Pseudonocardiaceae bacterium]